MYQKVQLSHESFFAVSLFFPVRYTLHASHSFFLVFFEPFCFSFSNFFFGGVFFLLVLPETLDVAKRTNQYFIMHTNIEPQNPFQICFIFIR